MKKILWGVSFAAFLGLAVIVHATVFGISDTPYEKWMRSMSASTVRALLALDSNDFENPVALEQTYLIDDSLIAMSSKLVYSSEEPVVLHSLSRESGLVKVYSISDSTKSLLTESTIPANKEAYWTTVNTQKGFDVSAFAAQELDKIGGVSGWLQIEVSVGADTRYIPVFKESATHSARALFVESTNTLMAYNSANHLWNGYENPLHLEGKFTRPSAYPMDYRIVSPVGPDAGQVKCKDHLINADLALKAALTKQNLVFDQTSDQALARNPIPGNYDLLIFPSHSEYWSSETFKRVSEFVARGGSVLFLGGNTAWRFVEESTGGFSLFWGNGTISEKQSRFVDEILGTYWDMRGYGTTAPMKTTAAATLFDADVRADVEFGKHLLVPKCEREVNGISGYETDKLRITSSPAFSKIAVGQNPWAGGADVVFRSLPAGGHILNFSSTGTWQGVEDPLFERILSAYLHRVFPH